MYKILLSLIFVASVNAEIVGGVAIVVKGEAITLYELKEEMNKSNVDIENASNILIRKKLEEIEMKKRNINVDSSEVYEEIKKSAARNNMSVNAFYAAELNSNGINSTQLKKKIKNNLERKKLYSSISYSHLEEPTDSEIEEYYNLHKNDLVQPSSFSVVIYQTNNKEILSQKIQNPMFNSSQISYNEQTLPYDRISPELANLLKRTAINNFSPIVPNGKGGYMTFYLKKIVSAQDSGFENMKNLIKNLITSEKREQVLSDYFARLRVNAEINVIRVPN